MLKLGRVTKVKVLFLVLVFVFHFDLFKFSAAILEKGLLWPIGGAFIREEGGEGVGGSNSKIYRSQIPRKHANSPQSVSQNPWFR